MEEAATSRRSARVGLRLPTPDAGEVGYWVDPVARGRGAATAAVRTVCEWALTTLHLDIIQWSCEVGNTVSRRVAEKAGFLIEATLRKRLRHRGQRVDAWVGSILNEEAT